MKNDGLSNENKGNKKRRLPLVISVVVVLLILILIPLVMNALKQEQTSPTTGEKVDSLEESNENKVDSAEEPNEPIETNNQNESSDIKTAVYSDEIDGYTVFTIGLASDAADSIPVTILIPNNQIKEEFGHLNPTGVELYNQYAPIIDEEALGFIDYHPYVGIIREEGNIVIHQLPENQSYDMASASLETYTASLIDTFSNYGYEEIEFLNKDGTPFVFDEIGEPIELKLETEQTQYNYFKFTQNDGKTYLAPNFRETFNSVEEALDAMKVENNDIYQSVILPNIDFTSKVNQNTVIVTFSSSLNLEDYPSLEVMYMIEGILLTAKSFGLQVQFENVTQENWEGFDFTKPLPIPVGPNKVPLTLQ